MNLDRYRLSQHAQTVVEARRIRAEWLRQVLDQPQEVVADTEQPEIEKRYAPIRERGDRVLLVVVNVSHNPPLVVAAFFDRRMKGLE